MNIQIYARHFARSEQLRAQWNRDLRNPNATFKFLRIVNRAIRIRQAFDNVIASWLEGGDATIQQARELNEQFKRVAEQYKAAAQL